MNKILLSSALIFTLSIGSVSAQSLIADGNVKVDHDELMLAIDSILPESTQQGMREKEQNIRLFLIDYFTFKQMAEAARKEGLSDDKSLKIQRDYTENKLLTQALIEKYIDSAKQPNYELLAKEAYLTDRDRFSEPEQVKAEHILIAINTDQDDAAALVKANELYAQVQKKGSNFSELAKQHSDDPSAETNSGDLGYFTREQMVQPFADAAFSMKKGQISKPVKSSFGYHIIRVLERKSAAVKSFDEVKEELLAEQRSNYRVSKRREIVDSFQNRGTIVIDDAAFAEFVKEFQKNTKK